MTWNTQGSTVVKGATGLVQPVSDGVETSGRLGRQHDLIFSQWMPKYYEQVKRGNGFAFATTVLNTTPIHAGNLVGAAAAAVTDFAVWNPVNSGKDVVINKIFAQIAAAGTLPAGPMWHDFFIASAVTATSTLVPINCYGGLGSGSVLQGIIPVTTGTTLTGGALPFLVRPSSINFSAGAYSNLGGICNAMEEVCGDLILSPGMGYVPMWFAAGSTITIRYGLSWFEVPL